MPVGKYPPLAGPQKGLQRSPTAHRRPTPRDAPQHPHSHVRVVRRSPESTSPSLSAPHRPGPAAHLPPSRTLRVPRRDDDRSRSRARDGRGGHAPTPTRAWTPRWTRPRRRSSPSPRMRPRRCPSPTSPGFRGRTAPRSTRPSPSCKRPRTCAGADRDAQARDRVPPREAQEHHLRLAGDRARIGELNAAFSTHMVRPVPPRDATVVPRLSRAPGSSDLRDPRGPAGIALRNRRPEPIARARARPAVGGDDAIDIPAIPRISEIAAPRARVPRRVPRLATRAPRSGSRARATLRLPSAEGATPLGDTRRARAGSRARAPGRRNFWQ